MFVVVVQFEVAEAELAAFLPLMRENAAQSVAMEPGCHQFDVCLDPKAPGLIFLYEIYEDAAAFEAHLLSDHFRTFDAATSTMILSKEVRQFERLET